MNTATQSIQDPSHMLASTDLVELMSAFNTLSHRLESTHVRLTQEVERLRAQLAEANAEVERSRRLSALGEMAAGIAHEVRNPLGSIGLYARLLAEDLHHYPDQQNLARKIGCAVRGLDAIVNDVLTFSKETRLHHELVSAHQIVEESLNRCADLLNRGVRIVRGPGLVADQTDLECDRPMLVQALANIIRNAIEASTEPGSGGVVALDVRTSADFAGSGPRVPMVVFRVEDSGPGIGDEVMDRMFNPFFTTRPTGTGLGLAIVHRIVEAHGGRVVVHREGGCGPAARGACFEIQVPGSLSSTGLSEVTRVISGGAAEQHSQPAMERAG